MKHINRLLLELTTKEEKFTVPIKRGWKRRHLSAVMRPQGPERGIMDLFQGWLLYADYHKERFKGGIGEDYFLGPEWVKIGLAIRTLLNGELGRLNGGTLDAVILDTLSAEGFDGQEEKMTYRLIGFIDRLAMLRCRLACLILGHEWEYLYTSYSCIDTPKIRIFRCRRCYKRMVDR